MASEDDPPSPLLVRVRESVPRLPWKLEKYFQSRKADGGECTVRRGGGGAQGPFEVQFRERAGELPRRGRPDPVQADLGEGAGHSTAPSGGGREPGLPLPRGAARPRRPGFRKCPVPDAL